MSGIVLVLLQKFDQLNLIFVPFHLLFDIVHLEVFVKFCLGDLPVSAFVHIQGHFDDVLPLQELLQGHFGLD